jgi:hypothetical protein
LQTLYKELEEEWFVLDKKCEKDECEKKRMTKAFNELKAENEDLKVITLILSV